jgi:hypothetical protein
MKKKLTRMWGVGIVIVLMATLCLIPASPAAAADQLRWNKEVIPGAPGSILINGSTLSDMAVSADDDVIYAVGGDVLVYKSTNVGMMWSEIDTDAGTKVTTAIDADFVAVANDDSDMVVIVDQNQSGTGAGTDGYVYVSVDGGTEWGLLGDLGAVIDPAVDIYDVAVSPQAGGAHQVAIAVDDDGLGNGNVWTIELGIGGNWTDQSAATGAEATNTWSDALACAFSPNFASDLTLAVVTTDGTDTFFEILQMTTTPAWNASAGFDNYPVTMEDSASNPVAAQAAAIAMAPTYIGGDEMERIAFVGIDVAAAGGNGDGVYRLEDYICKQVLEERDIHSVAFDGSTCVAGEVNATTVWRSADPLTSIPTFRGSATLKSPGGADYTNVGFAGTTVVAATHGNESAFAISEDNGQSFNDISLINTDIVDINDLAVSPDGAVVYMVTDDGNDLSVWRNDGGWQRVLSVQATTDYIVRVSPDDPDIVYVGQFQGTNLYYSKAGGDTKWYKRSAPGAIHDIAVESTDVAYIAMDGTTSVTKTDNGGFVWDPEVNTEVAFGNLNTIVCIGEDQLIVGSTEGCVSYSTDGNESWNKLPPMNYPTANYMKVAADGLEEGNHIYAATPAESIVYMWTIGTPPSEPWDDVTNGGLCCATCTWTGCSITGLVVQGGTLYACITDFTNSTFVRNTMPWMPEVGWRFWSQAADVTGEVFFNWPTEMRVSATADYNKVWACGSAYPPAYLYSYMDSLALAAPTALAPEDGATVAINAESGLPYNVTFTWTRPSKATSYTIMIALDPMFQEVVVMRMGCVDSTYDTISLTLTTDPPGNGFGSLATLTPGNTYYWAVQAATPLTSGLSSMPGRSFTLESGVAVAPSIGSPANGASSVSGTPAFSWSPVAGSTMYEFQLSVGTTFTETLYSGTLPETGIRPPVELDPGVTYFWRVRSIEPVVGDWSTIANFTVAVPAEAPPPPVEIVQQPAPVIEIPAPEPAPIINIPAAPEQPAPTAQGYIWAIIIIGAILVIALVVLIVRTRRQV